MAVSLELLDFLRRTDTCTVSNAIETFNVRMRNEGFVHGGLAFGNIRCMFPDLPQVAGYAVTGRFRAAAPPISGLCYHQRPDFWRYVDSIPGPKIVVMRDMDTTPGLGAMVGEIHAQIGKALGCVAWLTNGAVRDLTQVREADFQCFASGATVSHSYAHIVDFGEPVEIDGLKISTGDLLHGDLNGIHSIPFSIAEQIPKEVNRIRQSEAELVRVCKSKDFTVSKLEQVLGEAAPWSQNLEVR
jgi:4-hydroxy-4-methyl-2-oxoglutarate aldolase